MIFGQFGRVRTSSRGRMGIFMLRCRTQPARALGCRCRRLRLGASFAWYPAAIEIPSEETLDAPGEDQGIRIVTPRVFLGLLRG